MVLQPAQAERLCCDLTRSRLAGGGLRKVSPSISMRWEWGRELDEELDRQAGHRGTAAPPQPNSWVDVLLSDDADRAGGELRQMARQCEKSEMIDLTKARYELVQVKQQRYMCRCGDYVETALEPNVLILGAGTRWPRHQGRPRQRVGRVTCTPSRPVHMNQGSLGAR